AVEHIVAGEAGEAVERSAALDHIVDVGAAEGDPLDAGQGADDGAVPGDVAVAGEAADVERDPDGARADSGARIVDQDRHVGPGAAEDHVRAVAAFDRVRLGAAGQPVGEGIAGQAVGEVRRADQILDVGDRVDPAGRPGILGRQGVEIYDDGRGGAGIVDRV